MMFTDDKVTAVEAYGSLVSALADLAEQDSGLENSEEIQRLILDLQALVGSMRDVQGVRTDALLPESLRPSEFLEGATDPVQLLRSIDEVRVRMVGVLLSAGKGLEEVASPSLFSAENVGAMITCSSGLTYAHVGSSCVVLMPAVGRSIAAEPVIADFLQVFDGSRGSRRWVVDCSAVIHLPIMLQASILGYRETLNQEGRGLDVVWLRRDTMPDRTVARFSEAMRLRDVGRFLFSHRG